MKNVRRFSVAFFLTLLILAAIIWFVKIGMNKIGDMERIFSTVFVEKSLDKQLKLLNAKVGDKLFIRIFKEEYLFEVWIETDRGFELLKEYQICTYSGELGPKLAEGDRQAPEGFYRVYKGSLNPNSKYHLSFNLGFPNKYDRSHGRTGSYLMVHGRCSSIGCYAMTDERIEEIYSLVESALEEGQVYVPVHIFPFRMSDEKLSTYQDHQWFDFWLNLQEGYDYFEAEKRPPLVKAIDKRYEFFESVQ